MPRTSRLRTTIEPSRVAHARAKADLQLSVRVPTHRSPTHPGEILSEEFLEPLGMSQSELARRIGMTFQNVNALINKRRGITVASALRLGRLFGTSPEFWL